MRLNEYITLPNDIEFAQQDDDLVVFAGAGVSVGGDSNLPSFEELVHLLARDSLREPKEPYDRFLGELVNDGIPVHQRTYNSINDPDSKSNQIHYDLLRIFNSHDSVRLVTTNFDRHFTTAAETVFEGNTPEIYVGPAVPLGRNFHGIVYLHGSVDKDYNDFILTDKDFSDAYITDGWARRFLITLFQRYTVLFIGYGHRDPIIPYISLGAPIDNKRFTLIADGNDVKDQWEYYGIHSTVYPEDEHSILHDAIHRWATRTTRGAFAKEEEIKKLVSGKPPLDETSTDRILEALEEIETTRYFVNHADNPEWIPWLRDHNVLDALFENNRTLTEIDRWLAGWAARVGITKPPEFLFRNDHGKPPILNPQLWDSLVMRLTNEDPLSSIGLLNKWINLLTQAVPEDASMIHLEHLFENYPLSEDTTGALILFDTLTKPRVQYQAPILLSDQTDDHGARNAKVDINTRSRSERLVDIWEKRLKPMMDSIVDELLPISLANIREAHRLFNIYGFVNDSWDRLSSMRSAIEPHPQDELPHEFDVLIDVIRDSLSWYISHQPTYSESLITKWMDSPVLLLNRIAVDGLRRSTSIPSKDKIHIVVKRNWLFHLELNHEVYTLLGEIYPDLPQETREFLITKIREGFESSNDSDDAQKRVDYEIYSMLSWLKRKDTSCEIVGQAFDEYQAQYPKFNEPEHPDFIMYHSDVKYGFDNIPTEDLCEMDAAEAIDTITDEFAGDNGKWMSKSRNLDSAIAGCEFQWGIDIATELIQREDWDSETWTGIYWGWRSRELSLDELDVIAQLLLDHPQVLAPGKPVATLLERKVLQKEQDLPIELFRKFEQIGFQTFERIKDKSDNGSAGTDSSDWLTTAINHGGGIVTEFWLKSLSFLYNNHRQEFHQRVKGYQAVFTEMAEGREPVHQMGATVLSGQIHFLYGIMPEWTREHLFPLLDPDENDRHLHHAWHGYLAWGKWSQDYINAIFPSYHKYYQEIAEQSERIQQSFCDHLAAIAFYSDIHPIDEGWLYEFLQIVSPEIRHFLSVRIGSYLKQLDDQATTQAWNTWLRQYIQDRIRDVPVPLDEDEAHDILQWTSYLEPVLAEMVAFMVEMRPIPDLNQTHFYYTLKKEEVATRHPTEILELLQHFLQNTTEPFIQCRIVSQVVEQLIDSGAERDRCLAVIGRLLELGCAEAHDLRELLE